MWELDQKEGWALKNWYFWTMVLEKTLKSPLDCKEIKLVNPKRNQPWIFVGRTDAEAEVPILWPPDVKSWLTGRDPMLGKTWKPTPVFLPGEFHGKRSLAGYSPWDRKESGMTEWLTHLLILGKIECRRRRRKVICGHVWQKLNAKPGSICWGAICAEAFSVDLWGHRAQIFRL